MNLAKRLRKLRKRNRKVPKARRKVHFEPLEPRFLLSADLNPEAAALADGLDLFGYRVDGFLGGEALLGERVPLLLIAEVDSEGALTYEAPTIDDLFSVPVDANGDGIIDKLYINDDFPFLGLYEADDDESILAALDKDAEGTPGYGEVDAGEFLEGWFFEPVTNWLDSVSGGTTTEDFTDFLKGNIFVNLDHYLNDLCGVYEVSFNIIDAQVVDFTQDPDAQVSFSVGFELSIMQSLPIDLGLEADALKLQAFTGSPFDPQLPTVPVTSTLRFGFDFGVFTGGQAPGEINVLDFFIRSADPLVLSVTALDSDLDFNFNIGFLGAQVVDGSLDLQADIVTELLDPDDPDVLGFTDSQHGVEETSGVVTAANDLVGYDLAHDAGFFLRIGNVGMNTAVAVADNDAATWNDLKTDIENALSGAGLTGVVEVSFVDTDSDTIDDSVQFSLLPTSDTPLGFANESLGLAGEISATPDGDGPNIYEYITDQTFLLSIGGAIPTPVTVVFPDPSHTDIGFNDGQAASVPPLVAPSAPLVYDISGNADFIVTVWKNDGTNASHSFTLTDTDTDGNGSAADLAADIGGKLAGSSIDTLVSVDIDGSGYIRFNSVSTVSAIRVQASGTATTEIGFAADETVTLQLLGAGAADADLSEPANFKLTLNDAGTTTTYTITVPDNDRVTLNDLASDINAAIDAAVGSDRINVVDSSGKILLAGNDTNVRSFSIKTINENLDDLILDVNRALEIAGLGSAVTASADGGLIKLTAAGGKSLEISKTLTFDAGVTAFELASTEPTDLFEAAKGVDDSHVELLLPVEVFPGLEDASTPADDDWQPANVAIVGNFSPFDADSTIAEYNDIEKRYDLNFTYDPTIDNQDSPVGSVPAISSLSDEIQLVNMAEPLNFNLVTAESMVGLIMGLGTALQQIADSGHFATYDMPFADASLSEVLNFSDPNTYVFSGLIDTLLIYDTGGNGIDEPGVVDPAPNDTNKLLKRIIDDKTGDGETEDDDVYLFPDFVTAQELADKLDEILADMDLAGINANYDTTSNKLTYDVELIGGERTSIGILDTKPETVEFDPYTVPFEYDVDLSPFAKMTLYPAEDSSDLVNLITGYTGLDMTFGIDLSPPGAVISGDTKLALLNGEDGIDIKTERAVTGLDSVRAGLLSEDAHFQVDIPGVTSGWILVTVDAEDTENNYSYSHLADDINVAIGETDAAGLVTAAYDAEVDRLKLELAGPGETLKVYVWEYDDPEDYDTAFTELGFAMGYSVPGETVYALRSAAIGRLTGDAEFSLTVGTDDPVTVTVTEVATASNHAITDLVADVDNALIAEGLGDLIKADFDFSRTQGKRLVLSAKDPDIEFTVEANNPIAENELGLPGTETAANQSDFVIYDSSGHTYEIALDDEFVDLSGPTPVLTGDVDALIAYINDEIADQNDNAIPPVANPTVVVAFNSTQTGLQLYDETGGTGTFNVETINGSGAILTLGFFGNDDEGTQEQLGGGDPYLIEGGPIGLTHLDDRFFVRDAELWGAIKLQTPNPPPMPPDPILETPGAAGSALFGIVGVDTHLDGTLYAEFTADIKDPDTGVAGGTATLLELFEGAKQGRLSHDAMFNVQFDSGPVVPVTVYKSATVDNEATLNINEANDTLEDLVEDVNEALETAFETALLDTQIEARASGTRIEFVSLVEDNPATESTNEAAFTITASGIGAAELGLSGTLDSEEDIKGEQIIAARSASRYAVDEPVVTEAYELGYDNQSYVDLPGWTEVEFETGSILYGFSSGAMAMVLSVEDTDAVGTLTLARIKGTFTDDEMISQIDPDANEIAFALADGTVTQNSGFGEFNLHVDVQDGFATQIDSEWTGFGAGFALLDGQPPYEVDFALTDFGNPYDPAPPVATFEDLENDTGDLYAFKDLSYADIGVAFEDLLGVLVDVNENFTFLNYLLPAIGKSVSELLNLVDGFEFGVENLDEILAAAIFALKPEGTDIPALTLQDIPNALRGAFGFPEGVDPDGVDPDGFPNVDWFKLDFDKVNNMLLVDMSMNEMISTKLGLDINVGSGLANLTSAGVLIVEGALDINLSFGIDLADPTDAYLFDDTSISGYLEIVGEGQTYSGGEDGLGLVFRASLGALSVFIQDGDALIDVDFELPGLDFSGEATPGQKLIRDVVWGDWNTPVKNSVVEIVLPMFYGGEGPNDYIGDFSATGGLGGLTVGVPDFSDILDDIELGVLDYDPFDNILLAVDILNLYLEGLTDILADEVLGVKMPFIGDQMADILFIESFRNPLYSTLKNKIENHIDPGPDDVTDWIEDLLGVTVTKTSNMSGDYKTWSHQWDFTLSGDKTISLSDFDLGIPNLGFDMNVPVDVQLHWVLDLGFGVNYDEVAYIDVSDSNEIALDLTISPQDGSGTLGFLQFNATISDTEAVLNFDVDVVNENVGGDYIGFSDLGSIDPVAIVKGNFLESEEPADPEMFTFHLVTEAKYGLPQLAADLVIDWALPEGTPVNSETASLEGNAVTPPEALGIGVDYIALLNMEFDSGSVARSLLEPLFGTVLQYIEPFMPVVDLLTAPIPVLSDLAGEPFTILDLAEIFGSVDSEFIDAVADILDVISSIDAFLNAPPLPLGDLVIYDANDTVHKFIPNDPDYDLAGIDVWLSDLGGQPDPPEPPNPSTTNGWTFNGVPYDINADDGFKETIDGNDFLTDVWNGNLADGLTMPILTDPRQGVRLFLDQNAVMVDYKLPPLGVEFEYLQVFPVWGPLAVSIEISFGFTVDLHSVGFDTYGFQRYADGGFRYPFVMFDGFYLNDENAEGVDDPEVLFEFGLVGAAELNLGIARAGVGGGINATIYFDWFDPIADGRVHISELIGNVISADPGPNPLAVFDLGGALTFQLFAFLEISLLGIEEDFPITPETELFSFEHTFDHDPILATDIGDGVLQLNVGPNSEDRLYGDISDGHEELVVDWVSGNTVEVTSTKFGVSTAQVHDNITHIVGIGRQGNENITLNLGGSNITYELEGGLGDDTIDVSGGGGGTIRGGVGNDTLTGGAGNDFIWGEEGNDVIDGGGGYDILFGDQGRYFDSDSDPDPLITSRITGSDGDDTISGGTQDDIIIGAGGDDTLSGDAGNDVIIGDGGRFAYDKVGDHFEISAVLPGSYNDYEAPGIHDYVDPGDISDDIDEIHDDVLEVFHATDLGFGGNDNISGGEGGDLIFGGTADDVINGDAGDDLIFGGKGFDDIHGGANDDTIFGEDQADTISGNEGNDVISGGTGNDYIHGNEHNDVMKGDSGADVMFGDSGEDVVLGQTEPDVLMGGADNDLVVGGTGCDIMFGDDGVVAKLDQSTGTGLKVVYNTLEFTTTEIDTLLAEMVSDEGNYIDDDIRTVDLIQTYVVTGDGNDYLSGNAGDDLMFGGGGNDTMGGDVDPRLETFVRPTEISEDVMIGDGGRITFDQRRFRSIATVIGDTTGSPFNDTIYGDNGNDYILGGRGNDTLAGGHGPDRGATDEEASDNDVIIGDNGALLFADDLLGETTEEQRANFGRLTLIRTTDIANDTGGWDTAYGEEGADVILGGVNNDDGLNEPEVDKLYGDYYDYTLPVPAINIGNDIILGDNGLLDFALGSDTNLDTLDLIHSEPYAVTDWSTEPPTLDTNTILGGVDIIDGSFGYDVLIGGVAGDEMYGDDETASNGANDGEDIMLGDNGDIFLIGNVGRLLVQVTDMPVGTAVDLITTTDIEDETGGADTMSGNAKADIMLGGVNNGGTDTMYGDRSAPDSTTISNDGDDILVGDNGLLDFTYGGDESDLDRQTLDYIHSEMDGLGGVDIISGNKGLDVAIGGTAGDTIYGDAETLTQLSGPSDLADLLLGDNADIFLVPRGSALLEGDIKLVLPLGLATDAAVKTIRTTDDEGHPEYGGRDTISGNAKGDIIAGGVDGDTIYGDREVPNTTTEGDEGDDIILGDNGAFEWLSEGRLGEVTGINIEGNNPDLYDWFTNQYPGGDEDLTTLDLVTTEQPTSGGRDTIYGDEGKDLVFAGTDADTIYGDDATLDEIPDSSNNDLIFGDHGRIYPQFPRFRLLDESFVPADYPARNFFAIDIGDSAGGEGDRIWGEEGDDTMVGQQGDDRMWGGSGDDDMTGGHNVAGGYDELTSFAIDASLDDTGIEVPAIDDVNDLMDGGTGNDSMAGDNAIIWRRGDDLSPRFRELTEDSIYTTTPDTITANIGADWQSDPDDAIGRDIELVDHSDSVQADPQGRFGADVMAGGADSDVMFGQLGNDLMQGDGLIETSAVGTPFLSYKLDVDDSGYVPPDPDTSETLYFNIPEAATDADDYLEGSGGSDLMYGGLGQDDMIGGSSELFGLDDANAALLGMTAEELRPDDSDFIFGGAGIDIDRNDIGDTTFDLASEDPETHVIATEPDGHARDADYIMGDNANMYRLVEAASDEFLQFNYDDVYGLQIIPRAMEQLDYQLGGADYNGGEYVDGAADPDGAGGPLPSDNGAADLIHGESGDDIIFGMTGSDVMFGEGQDDDIIGGYGHDWISGGTGQDGILGDDGLIYTSRNSTIGEPLNNIEGLDDRDPSTKYNNGNVLDETIKTPGEIQYAIINVSGLLKKTADLVPFSYDPTWMAMDDEFDPDDVNQAAIPYADDIIFGGLGSDWLHGGSGDDAISGAEALENAYVPDYYDFDNDENTLLLDLGYTNAGNPANLNLMNPGNVLAFNPVDLDGQHLNNRFRPGEFALYDEYWPLHKILLNDDGSLWDIDTQVAPTNEFLLNFDEGEGVVRPAGEVPKATGQQTETYPEVNDDGKDAIFGDLGNDWLVGGTGRDNIYGGWGNDLINADDDQTTPGNEPKHGGALTDNANDLPDTHPYYEDRAYGGAGRDILIANTGGDRLIDWVGEYNSYLVPYAPFGQASVSRTLMPHLQEFLYALSAGDGADPTRYVDAIGETPPEPTHNNPIPSRNGEPHGELGLVLQKDFAWRDQTGPPADPQAGNIPGGKRDVLRSANFNDGESQIAYTASGVFEVKNGVLAVSAESLGGDAISVLALNDYLPSYFEVAATITMEKPTGGWKANAYIIFDCQDETNFKFAGIDASRDKIQLGHRTEDGWIIDAETPSQIKPGQYYNVLVAVNGTNVTVRVDGAEYFTHTYEARVDADGWVYGLNAGMVGLGSDNSRGTFDNIAVLVLPPEYTLQATEDFEDTSMELLTVPQTGDWEIIDGRYEGVPAGGDSAVSLVDLGLMSGLAANSILDIEAIVNTDATSGIVFDCYASDDFKYTGLSADSDTLIIGHVRNGKWVIDATTDINIEAGVDYDLALSLKGTTVSVSVKDAGAENWQAVVGHVFNAVAVDGDFGLLSKEGTSSFDTVTVKTDDPAFRDEGDNLVASKAPQIPVEMNLSAGWNMISLPVIPDNPAVSALFPDAVVVYGYEKGKGYVRGDTMEIGKGYWILFNEAQSYALMGQPIQEYASSVDSDGWNMIGGGTDSVSVETLSQKGKKIDVIYEYVLGRGYQRVLESENLKPGKGYWILQTPVEPEIEPESTLTEDALSPIVDEAIARWTEALGNESTMVAALPEVTFQIVDLESLTLGHTIEDTVMIDIDAAGHGWFVDETPYDDAEFGIELGNGEMLATMDSEAYGQMDLLTAVTHELGHVLGLEDLDPETHDVMSATLDTGVRRLPGDSDIAALSQEGAGVENGSANLVVMDVSQEPDDTGGSLATTVAPTQQSSWLHQFLLNAGQTDDVDPNAEIRVVIPRDENV